VQAAVPANYLTPRPQQEMEGVAEDDFGAACSDLLRCDALHRAVGANRHERRCPHTTTSKFELADPGLETTLLHLDVRSDNLRWRNSRLTLLDWPHVVAGTPELDVAFFAQSVAAEGGPRPELVLPAYARAFGLDSDLLDASVSAVLSFFLAQAWLPELPGLPRLRRWQRKQLRATAEWAVRRLRLGPAGWTDALADSAPGPSL